MQQQLLDVRVRDLNAQHHELRQLKQYGTLKTFACPGQGEAEVSVVVYSDAGRLVDPAQLSFLVGLLVEKLEAESVFHTLSWSYHRSQRPVRSIDAAEILACGDAVNDGKTLA